MFWRAKKTSESSASSQRAEEARHVVETSPPAVMNPRNSDVVTPPISENGGGEVSRFMGMASSERRPFVLPSSYTVSGNLFTSRPVAVQGILEKGELVAPLAVILPGGQLRSTARVDVLKVYGGVSAAVHARRLVEVLDRGKVEGSIESPEISVAPGAIISGVSLSVGPKRTT